MPLGNTAKKLQKLADTAEELYTRINELRDQVVATKETVEETSDRMDRLEVEVTEQRALLEAIAEQQGVDLDAVAAEAHIGEAEGEGESEAGTDPDAAAAGEEAARPAADADTE